MADVSQTHPDYDKMLPDWDLVRDAIEGESAVKDQGDVYLPKPSGFTAQEDGGAKMYNAYQLRAKFPEIMGPSIRGMVGVIHRVAADIELPTQLEPMFEMATKDGQSLSALHERITYELLATGRYGLLVDAPADGEGDLPYIAGYKAETIINWSVDSDFFVLDETRLVRDGFQWDEVEQYRVLKLGEDDSQDPNAPPGVYTQQVFEGESEGEILKPTMRGGGSLEEIPFVVVGSTDVAADVDEIPLMGVARAAFTMFRLDADYKWQLFMSGQETLFVYSDTDAPVQVVGASVVINLPSGSKAEYIGPSGKTIEAHKQAIIDERNQAVAAGARIFDTEKKAQESGEALKIRFAAQTATLTSIAINSAKGLERALKFCALFVGADPDQVVVKPNLQFIDTILDPKDAKALMEMWMGGAISKQTLDENLQRGGIRSYERTFEEEAELIDEEIPDLNTPQIAREDQKMQQAQENAVQVAKAAPKLVPVQGGRKPAPFQKK